MGITNLAAFARSCGCLSNFSVENEAEIRSLLQPMTCVCFDFNTELHRTCYRYETTDPRSVVNLIRNDLCVAVAKQVAVLVYLTKAEDVIDVLIAMDGASPPGKRPEQRRRRRAAPGTEKEFWSEHLTAGSAFLKELLDGSFRVGCCNQLRNHLCWGQPKKVELNFYFDSDERPNEGEIKCLRFAKIRHAESSSVVVTTDNDVLAAALMAGNRVAMLTQLPLPRVTREAPVDYAKYLVSNRSLDVGMFNGNRGVTRWFGALLFASFGGDYLPKYLAASTTKQMDRLRDFLLDDGDRLSAADPLKLLKDVEGCRQIVRATLRAFEALSKCRRVTRKNRHYDWRGSVGDDRARLIVEWFMADLLWTLGHYGCSESASPSRTGFIVEDEDECLMFSALPNTYFVAERLDSQLDYERIYAGAFVDYNYREDWKNLSTFRREVL